MWYDKYPGTPPRNSPLETLFLLVHLSRKESDLFATRTLIRGQFAAISKSTEAAETAFQSYNDYAEAMFPFLEAAGKIRATDMERLMEHVRHPIEIDVKSLRQQNVQDAKLRALRKFQARVQE